MQLSNYSFIIIFFKCLFDLCLFFYKLLQRFIKDNIKIYIFELLFWKVFNVIYTPYTQKIRIRNGKIKRLWKKRSDSCIVFSIIYENHQFFLYMCYAKNKYAILILYIIVIVFVDLIILFKNRYKFCFYKLLMY